MKRIIFLICCSLSLIMTRCNSDKIDAKDVPASVQSAFNEKFPGATKIEWENAKENNYKTYEAKFDWKGKRMEAEFDGAGTFIKGHEK